MRLHLSLLCATFCLFSAMVDSHLPSSPVAHADHLFLSFCISESSLPSEKFCFTPAALQFGRHGYDAVIILNKKKYLTLFFCCCCLMRSCCCHLTEARLAKRCFRAKAPVYPNCPSHWTRVMITTGEKNG